MNTQESGIQAGTEVRPGKQPGAEVEVDYLVPKMQHDVGMIRLLCYLVPRILLTKQHTVRTVTARGGVMEKTVKEVKSVKEQVELQI